MNSTPSHLMQFKQATISEIIKGTIKPLPPQSNDKGVKEQEHTVLSSLK